MRGLCCCFGQFHVISFLSSRLNEEGDHYVTTVTDNKLLCERERESLLTFFPHTTKKKKKDGTTFFLSPYSPSSSSFLHTYISVYDFFSFVLFLFFFLNVFLPFLAKRTPTNLQNACAFLKSKEEKKKERKKRKEKTKRIMSLLYYKRPDYVEKRSEPMAACDYRTYLERQRASIPPELCFEYVISNRAVPVSFISPFSPLLFFFFFPFSFPFPLASSVFEVVEKWQKVPDLGFALSIYQPCSLHDFTGYLLYVSHDAENLQFYMWFQDYSKRFFQTISAADQALSPPWDEEGSFLTQAVTSNDQGPRRMMANQRYGGHANSDFAFDFDTKQTIPLGALSGNAFNAQMDLKWQPCE